MKPKKKWCYYCKHAGKFWKWVDTNHAYCDHPKTFNMDDRRDAIISAYDTCEDFELADKWTKLKEAV